MANSGYILAIDQGTTSSRAVLYDSGLHRIASAQAEFAQQFPANGWVEHDPEVIWQGVVSVCRQAIATSGIPATEIAAIGITNQRETTVVWDAETGKPVYDAIVWQDRRTAERCADLKLKGHERVFRDATGLRLDPYFSGTKLAWILDNVPGVRARAERGDLRFGTIDSFLIYRLTGGKQHLTDASNASRTLLFNIHQQCWDEALLEILDIPAVLLPDVLDCTADYGSTDPSILGASIPIAGVAGDQQAALFGQACFAPGMVKSTYGTGCFVISHTGDVALRSENQLLTTVASRLDGKVSYGLEGSIFVAGSAIQWLRDGIEIIDGAEQTEALARAAGIVEDVVMVPAFTGLGAPYWDPEARGAIFGLTRDVNRATLVAATLQSVAYQTADLIACMHEDGVRPQQLRVDGGMVENSWFNQFLADMIDVVVARPRDTASTVLGAASLAGLQVGFYDSTAELARLWQLDCEFSPRMKKAQRTRLYDGWRSAVQRVR